VRSRIVGTSVVDDAEATGERADDRALAGE
jgi:hypothetical protein